jgi:DNA processing protein
VIEHGCVLSEYPPGVAPRKHHFPVRNRIIAGLCGAVVVVEAPARSGALITANVAAAEGRDVMVHRGALQTVRAAGSRMLHADGAAAVGGVTDLAQVASATLQRYMRRGGVAVPAPPLPLAPGSWRSAGRWLVDSLRMERTLHAPTSSPSSPSFKDGSGA